MNKTVIFILGNIVGLSIGSVCGYFYANKKHRDLIDELSDKVYDSLNKTEINEEDNTKDDETDKNENTTVLDRTKKKKEKRNYRKKRYDKKNNKTSVSGNSEKEKQERIKLDVLVDNPDDDTVSDYERALSKYDTVCKIDTKEELEEELRRSERDIYLIDEKEYNQTVGYDKVNLICWKGQVFVRADNDEEIDNEVDYIGEEFVGLLNGGRLGEDGKPVYIRNEHDGWDTRVVVDDRDYYETVVCDESE